MLRSSKSRALFPIVPWLGFTFYGAFIGSLIFKFKESVLSWKAVIIVFVTGFLLYVFPTEILKFINQYILFGGFKHLHKIDWLYIRVGMILMIMSLLIAINVLTGEIKENVFLKMGQNTLTIFIVHFMVLYGSIIVIGINDFYNKNLTPLQAGIGAVLFVLFFALLVKYLDEIKLKLDFLLGPIKRFWSRVYKLN
jgi:hypothetical protein